MRRCTFKKCVIDGKRPVTLETVEGNFLEFGISFDAECNYPVTTAIIELDNGKIEIIFPSNVTFINKKEMK